jgi:uncharacterized protein (TIGR03083 family)
MSERNTDPRRAEIIKGYDQERDALLKLVGQIKSDVWEKPSPCPGWNAKDLFAHITAAAVNLPANVQRMLDGVPNPGKAALDARNEAGVNERRDRSINELINELKTSHQKNIDLLLSLTDDQLTVKGSLSSGELLTVEERFRRAGRHYRDHGKMLAQAAGLPENY